MLFLSDSLAKTVCVGIGLMVPSIKANGSKVYSMVTGF